MIAFLTSDLSVFDTKKNIGVLNSTNSLIKELDQVLPKKKLEGLFIVSSPDDFKTCERFGCEIRNQFEQVGFLFSSFIILDRRNARLAKQLVANADLIILAGGCVLTQNAFFHDLSLKEHMKQFQGVLVGISAGSMNTAEIVYTHSKDMESKYLPGLGLTKTMLLPHYQLIKEDEWNDIILPDSMGKQFYAIPDGTYLYCENRKEELHGLAYLIENGKICEMNKDNQVLYLTESNT